MCKCTAKAVLVLQPCIIDVMMKSHTKRFCLEESDLAVKSNSAAADEWSLAA